MQLRYRCSSNPRIPIGLHWIDLDVDGTRYRELLSEDEKRRVDRLVFEHDRRRCLVGWATRRLLLARILGREPASLAFGQELEGRPYLADRCLEFNLSHSKSQAVVAVTEPQNGLLVGVDIEASGRTIDLEPLSVRFFHPYEIAHLRAEGFAPKVFFRIWTAKESYLKALGTGLRKALDSFNVVSAKGKWELCEPPGQPLLGWSTHTFVHPEHPDYLGTLTLNRPDAKISEHVFEL